MGGSKSSSGSAQKWAKPFAIAGANEAQSVYNANKGGQQQLTDTIQGLVPTLMGRMGQTDPNVDAARGYNSDVLSGKYLNSNPYLQQILDQTTNDTLGAVGGAFGRSGAFGGTKYAEAAGKGLGAALGNIRYNDYNTQMGRMDQAASLAPTLQNSDAAVESDNLAKILQAAGLGAELPYTGLNAYTGSLAQLFNGGTQKQSTLGNVLQGIGSLGSAAGSMGVTMSDRRLKTNIEQIGSFPDGLGIYEYDIFGERQRGVMADEVERLRPWALGPVISGYQSVDYGAL